MCADSEKYVRTECYGQSRHMQYAMLFNRWHQSQLCLQVCMPTANCPARIYQGLQEFVSAHEMVCMFCMCAARVSVLDLGVFSPKQKISMTAPALGSDQNMPYKSSYNQPSLQSGPQSMVQGSY